MVLPAHAAAQAAALSELLEPLLLYLSLAEGRGVIVSIDGGFRLGIESALRPLVQGLLSVYPDLVVTSDPVRLLALPGDSVVLLCLGSENLTQYGRFLDLNRQLFDERCLRIILWHEEHFAERLVQAAPHFSDWIAHRMQCPAPMIQPAAHAQLGLRALVRAQVQGALFHRFSTHELEDTVSAALPNSHFQEVRERSYGGLLRALDQGSRNRLLCFPASWDFDQRRLLWALAETRWNRPCIVQGVERRPLGFWLLHDRYAPLPWAIDQLGVAEQPGRLALLLGLEPEAIALCARLLALGEDEAALHKELLCAPDPGAAVALRLAARGEARWALLSTGEASPPELRALWHRRKIRGQRTAPPASSWGDPSIALAQGDVAVALRWMRRSTVLVKEVQERVNEIVSSWLGIHSVQYEKGRPQQVSLCLLYDPIDRAYAEELADLLLLLPCLKTVSLDYDEGMADVVLPLLSGDFFVNSRVMYVFSRAKTKRRLIIPIHLRPCYLGPEVGLDREPLPSSQRAVSVWPDLGEAWAVVLRGVAGLISGP